MDFLDMDTVKGILSGSMPLTTMFILYIKHIVSTYKEEVEKLQKTIEYKDNEINNLRTHYESRLIESDKRYDDLLLKLYTDKDDNKQKE